MTMEFQGMEHVSTLCALGTIAVGAAGLALGFEDGTDENTFKSSKRKAPGTGTDIQSSRSLRMSRRPPTARRAVSQPAPSANGSVDETAQNLLRPSTVHNASTIDAEQMSTSTVSRQSSVGPPRALSSRGDTSQERKDSGSASSWLRRISTMSSLSGSFTSITRPSTPSVSNTSATPMLADSAEADLMEPNKLVKRSTSQRALSSNRSAPLLRRPATSHQRLVTLQQQSGRDPLPSQRTAETNQLPTISSTPPVWRPYFDSGYSKVRGYNPRKRHTSGASRINNVRTISETPDQYPTLLLGSSVGSRLSENDLDDVSDRPEPFTHEESFQESPKEPLSRFSSIRKSRRFSITDIFSTSSGEPAGEPTVIVNNSRRSRAGRLSRRNFTDPIVDQEGAKAAQGGTSPLSPISGVSTFEIQLPRGTPQFLQDASPEITQSAHQTSPRAPMDRTFRSKRVSIVPSDPTTLSSDNDTRVFTDEESMDFHSDTAYDSIATRGTTSSRAQHGPQIETIFDESPPTADNKGLVGLEDLVNTGTLPDAPNGWDSEHLPSDIENRGIGISDLTDEDESMSDAVPEHSSTPVKKKISDQDDYMPTPVPIQSARLLVEMSSSPPTVTNEHALMPDDLNDIRQSIENMDLDESSNWDDFTDTESIFEETGMLPQLPKSSLQGSPNGSAFTQQPPQTGEPGTVGHVGKRALFDMSERLTPERDSVNGSSPRPQTVDGKQRVDGRGSRQPGRRGPSAMHLRSQSVPVNREGSVDSEATYPMAAKFGTWGLGSKGVSEEWTDDFDFDDLEEASDDPVKGGDFRQSIVPQAIIDRQASVRGQFGQVQEFMLLVEELKRLRVQGANYGLQRGQSRQLWEDAESIINLATLNDDDEDMLPSRPSISPNGFDDFEDDSGLTERTISIVSPSRRNTVNKRSISGPATPPINRPRGESLAQAKSFLQTIHQNRSGPESSPAEDEIQRQNKLPFDTQDLRDLVIRAGVITRALKEIVRKAEGVSVSPEKTPKRLRNPVDPPDPAFSQIFNRPPESPSPTMRKTGLPKSKKRE